MIGKARDINQLFIDCGFDAIDGKHSADQLERALRALTDGLGDADAVHRRIVRAEAIKKLNDAKVPDAAELYDAVVGAASIPFLESSPSDEPISAETLADLLAETLKRFVAITPAEADAVALWIMLTYVIDSTDTAPLLIVTSPTKRCGKTTLLTVLRALVFRGVGTSHVTPAALFRMIDMFHPTLLIDEGDAHVKGNEELRGILNAGHTRDGAFVIRAVPVDGGFEPRRFNVFGPKAIAAIGRMADTLHDRAITVSLTRKSEAQVVDRIRQDRIGVEFAPIRSWLARWAQDSREHLRAANPDVPSELHDRAQDNWRPLLAIADSCSPDWSDRARMAASELELRAAANEEPALAEMVLKDVHDIFTRLRVERLPSNDLVQQLNTLDDRPWPSHRDGEPMNAYDLAGLLRLFEIRPKAIRFDSVVLKGYELSTFRKAFKRYLGIDPKHPLQDGK